MTLAFVISLHSATGHLLDRYTVCWLARNTVSVCCLAYRLSALWCTLPRTMRMNIEKENLWLFESDARSHKTLQAARRNVSRRRQRGRGAAVAQNEAPTDKTHSRNIDMSTLVRCHRFNIRQYLHGWAACRGRRRTVRRPENPSASTSTSAAGRHTGSGRRRCTRDRPEAGQGHWLMSRWWRTRGRRMRCAAAAAATSLTISSSSFYSSTPTID